MITLRGIIVLIVATVASICPDAAFGKTSDPFTEIDKLVKELDKNFSALKKRKGAETKAVAYTGSDFSLSPDGFEWQNGAGHGWTKGERVIVANAKQAESDRLMNIFERLNNYMYVSFGRKENHSAVKIDDTRTLYAFDYDPDSRKLAFLKVNAEDQFCVPSRWITIDTLDATSKATPNGLSTSGVSESPYGNATARQMRQLGLANLWAGVKRNFVFMNRVKLNWDSLYVAMIPKMDSVATDAEATLLLQRMAAQLGDGHTYIQGYDMQEYLPILTKPIGDETFVDIVCSKNIVRDGVKRGMKIESINGMPTAEYASAVIAPYVSSSTPQWTKSQSLGTDLLKGTSGDSITITFSDGTQRLTKTYVFGQNRWELTPNGNLFTVDQMKDGTCYLKISNFMDGKFKQKFDKIYPEILKSNALIIDIRGNGGGNSGNADYVLQHLTSDRIKTDSWKSPIYIPAYASWGRDAGWHESPNQYMDPIKGITPYEKPIVVLTDAGTFSAAEDFCSVFRGMNRGKIFGKPTGGSTGNGVQLTLIPNVAYANICSKHDTGADGVEFVGIGIIPDTEIEETPKSVFEDDIDATTSAAIEYLRAL